MNLETFFEKFDLFADAPDAVAKMQLALRRGDAENQTSFSPRLSASAGEMNRAETQRR